MAISNEFLVNVMAHDNIVGNCFCNLCRDKRLERLQGVSVEVLSITASNIYCLSAYDERGRKVGHLS